MQYASLLSLVLATALVAVGCDKDNDDEGYRAAGINFRSEAGYTFENDSVAVGDTLLIGVLVGEGTERLSKVLVDVAYDGGDMVRIDSVPFTSNPLSFDVEAVIGDVPGMQQWRVSAVENGGSITTRSLYFTVE